MNNAALAFVHYTSAEAAALQITSLRPPEAVPALLDFLADDAVHYHWTGVNRYRRKDGAIAEMEVTSYPLTWHGRPARCVIGTTLVSQRHDRRQREPVGLYDHLTGLPNRTLFTDRVKHAARRAQRDPAFRFSVLFLDLDRFRNINDSLGYRIGDDLLLVVASRLREVIAPAHTIGRFGGDMFGILLDGIAETSDAVRIAESLLTALSAPLIANGQEIVVNASIGIVHSDISGSAEYCLRDATIALERAKEHGKARYEVFDRVMHERIVQFVRTESDLRKALERGEFRVHYQPIVALVSGQVQGFEALARWQHPQRGLVPPAEFVPIAEETGLLPEIAAWIRRESCAQMREWLKTMPALRHATMGVNIAATSFSNPQFVQEIAGLLAETGLPPERFQLEITESAMMRNADAIAMLNQVRALGVRISMDNFGTGYSSLSYLHQMPIDTLKIDRSFIWNMGAAGKNVEIVRAIVRLGQTMGMEVVAEGVETAVQREQLNLLGCDTGQGYYFARPAPAQVIEATLARTENLRLAPALVPPCLPTEFFTAGR